MITGLRGAVGARLEVTGPARDLHAGSFGGAVANPAEALAALVASLHDKAGRVAVPGFYDQVRPMTEAERCHLARAGPDDATHAPNERFYLPNLFRARTPASSCTGGWAAASAGRAPTRRRG